MSKKYKKKPSIALRLCKTIAFFLFLTFTISFILMCFDLDLITGMSNERKEELLASESFQNAVTIADKISKNPSKYGEFEDVKIIIHNTDVYRDYLGIVHTDSYLVVKSKNRDNLYFRCSGDFEEIDFETFSQAKSFAVRNVHSTQISYSNAELKYIRELLNQENIK